MANFAGYALIIIGIVLLAYDLGYVNFSILTAPLALPIAVIVTGAVELVTKIFNTGDFGRALRMLMAIILILTVALNFSAFIYKIAGMPYVYTGTPVFSANGTHYSCVFCNLNSSISSNKITIDYDGQIFTSNESSNDYSLSNSFSNAYENFGGAVALNGTLSLVNNFGRTVVVNANSFSTITADNNFGLLELHTSAVSGAMEIVVDNNFGSANVYIDGNADYFVESSAAFGTVNNYIGLKSSGYDTAVNKVHIVAGSRFGAINLYKE